MVITYQNMVDCTGVMSVGYAGRLEGFYMSDVWDNCILGYRVDYMSDVWADYLLGYRVDYLSDVRADYILGHHVDSI